MTISVGVVARDVQQHLDELEQGNDQGTERDGAKRQCRRADER